MLVLRLLIVFLDLIVATLVHNIVHRQMVHVTLHVLVLLINVLLISDSLVNDLVHHLLILITSPLALVRLHLVNLLHLHLILQGTTQSLNVISHQLIVQGLKIEIKKNTLLKIVQLNVYLCHLQLLFQNLKLYNLLTNNLLYYNNPRLFYQQKLICLKKLSCLKHQTCFRLNKLTLRIKMSQTFLYVKL